MQKDTYDRKQIEYQEKDLHVNEISLAKKFLRNSQTLTDAFQTGETEPSTSLFL